MKQNFCRGLLPWLLAVALLLPLAMPTLADGGAANVTMAVSDSALAVGDTVSVTVSSNAMTVCSFACGIYFDREKLECVRIEGPDAAAPDAFFLTRTAGYPVSATAVSTAANAAEAGTVGFVIASANEAEYAAGTVYTATFRAIAAGSAAFTLYEDSSGSGGYNSDAVTTQSIAITSATADTGSSGTATAAAESDGKSAAEDTTDTESGSGFADLQAGAYYADAVAWAVQQGVTTGTSDTTFSPDAGCTRAQAVTFLWRAAGSPAPDDVENPFVDVNEDDYAFNAILWAVQNGITAGTGNGAFSPEDTCTRAQIVTFLYRCAGEPEAGGEGFSDVSAEMYYADAVAWAAETGIAAGTGDGAFSPEGTCTRAQIVTFLYRAET